MFTDWAAEIKKQQLHARRIAKIRYYAKYAFAVLLGMAFVFGMLWFGAFLDFCTNV